MATAGLNLDDPSHFISSTGMQNEDSNEFSQTNSIETENENNIKSSIELNTDAHISEVCNDSKDLQTLCENNNNLTNGSVAILKETTPTPANVEFEVHVSKQLQKNVSNGKKPNSASKAKKDTKVTGTKTSSKTTTPAKGKTVDASVKKNAASTSRTPASGSSKTAALKTSDVKASTPKSTSAKPASAVTGKAVSSKSPATKPSAKTTTKIDVSKKKAGKDAVDRGAVSKATKPITAITSETKGAKSASSERSCDKSRKPEATKTVQDKSTSSNKTAEKDKTVASNAKRPVSASAKLAQKPAPKSTLASSQLSKPSSAALKPTSASKSASKPMSSSDSASSKPAKPSSVSVASKSAKPSTPSSKPGKPSSAPSASKSTKPSAAAASKPTKPSSAPAKAASAPPKSATSTSKPTSDVSKQSSPLPPKTSALKTAVDKKVAAKPKLAADNAASKGKKVTSTTKPSASAMKENDQGKEKSTKESKTGKVAKQNGKANVKSAKTLSKSAASKQTKSTAKEEKSKIDRKHKENEKDINDKEDVRTTPEISGTGPVMTSTDVIATGDKEILGISELTDSDSIHISTSNQELNIVSPIEVAESITVANDEDHRKENSVDSIPMAEQSREADFVPQVDHITSDIVSHEQLESEGKSSPIDIVNEAEQETEHLHKSESSHEDFKLFTGISTKPEQDDASESPAQIEDDLSSTPDTVEDEQVTGKSTSPVELMRTGDESKSIDVMTAQNFINDDAQCIHDDAELVDEGKQQFETVDDLAHQFVKDNDEKVLSFQEDDAQDKPQIGQVETSQEEAIQEERIQEEAFDEKADHEKADEGETVQGEVAQEGINQEEVAQEDACQEEAANEESAQEDACQEEALHEVARREEADNEEAVQEDACQEEGLHEQAGDEEADNEDAAQEDAIQEEDSKEETCQEEVSQEGAKETKACEEDADEDEEECKESEKFDEAKLVALEEIEGKCDEEDTREGAIAPTPPETPVPGAVAEVPSVEGSSQPEKTEDESEKDILTLETEFPSSQEELCAETISISESSMDQERPNEQMLDDTAVANVMESEKSNDTNEELLEEQLDQSHQSVSDRDNEDTGSYVDHSGEVQERHDIEERHEDVDMDDETPSVPDSVCVPSNPILRLTSVDGKQEIVGSEFQDIDSQNDTVEELPTSESQKQDEECQLPEDNSTAMNIELDNEDNNAELHEHNIKTEEESCLYDIGSRGTDELMYRDYPDVTGTESIDIEILEKQEVAESSREETLENAVDHNIEGDFSEADRMMQDTATMQNVRDNEIVEDVDKADDEKMHKDSVSTLSNDPSDICADKAIDLTVDERPQQEISDTDFEDSKKPTEMERKIENDNENEIIATATCSAGDDEENIEEDVNNQCKSDYGNGIKPLSIQCHELSGSEEVYTPVSDLPEDVCSPFAVVSFEEKREEISQNEEMEKGYFGDPPFDNDVLKHAQESLKLANELDDSYTEQRQSDELPAVTDLAVDSDPPRTVAADIAYSCHVEEDKTGAPFAELEQTSDSHDENGTTRALLLQDDSTEQQTEEHQADSILQATDLRGNEDFRPNIVSSPPLSSDDEDLSDDESGDFEEKSTKHQISTAHDDDAGTILPTTEAAKLQNTQEERCAEGLEDEEISNDDLIANEDITEDENQESRKEEILSQEELMTAGSQCRDEDNYDAEQESKVEVEFDEGSGKSNIGATEHQENNLDNEAETKDHEAHDSSEDVPVGEEQSNDYGSTEESGLDDKASAAVNEEQESLGSDTEETLEDPTEQECGQMAFDTLLSKTESFCDEETNKDVKEEVDEAATDGSDFVLLDSPVKRAVCEEDYEAKSEDEAASHESELDNSPFHHIEVHGESLVANLDEQYSQDVSSVETEAHEKSSPLPCAEDLREEDYNSHSLTEGVKEPIYDDGKRLFTDDEDRPVVDDEHRLTIEDGDRPLSEDGSNPVVGDEDCFARDSFPEVELTGASQAHSYGAIGPEVSSFSTELREQEDGDIVNMNSNARFVYGGNFDDDETY